jgi:hypothetical protein
MCVANSKLQCFDDISKCESLFESLFNDIYSVLGFKELLRKGQLPKTNGYSLSTLLRHLCLFSLSKKTINGASEGEQFADENTYYNVISNSGTDWRSIVQDAAWNFFDRLKKNDLDEKSRKTCIVLDDSLIEKHSKHIEGISMVYDHVSHSFKSGYKLLLCGIVDGRSFVPFDFSLHRERHSDGKCGLTDKERVGQYKTCCRHDSCGAQRQEDLDVPKPQKALSMTKDAISKLGDVGYVIADSWFTNPRMMAAIRELNVHYIGMAKSDRTLYTLKDGRKMTIAAIAKSHEHSAVSAKICDRCKCRHFCVRAEVGGVKVKLFFVKIGKSQDWQVLITTDLSLHFTVCYEYYSMRWSIEVCFRNCKQNTNITKCQSTSLISQIGVMSVAFLTYTMVTYLQRMTTHDSLGELFKSIWEEQLNLAIWGECQRLMARLISIMYMAEIRTVPEMLNLLESGIEEVIRDLADYLGLRVVNQNIG